MSATLPEYLEVLPPHAVDLEMACLGSALISSTAAEKLLEQAAAPDVWYYAPHRLIQVAMASLQAQDQAINLNSVEYELLRLGTLEGAGGMAYLLRLTEVPHTAAHLDSFLKPVLETAQRRRLMRAAGEIDALAQDMDRPLSEVVSAAEGLVYRAGAEGRPAGEWITTAELAARVLPVLAGEAPPACFSTGYQKLDWFMGGGWKPQRLVLLAARPAVGKTAAALNFALKLSKAGVPVGIFSLEMGAVDLHFRLISIESGLAGDQVESGNLAAADRSRALAYNGRIGDLPLHLWEYPSQTLAQVRGHARRLVRRFGVKALFIDYLQLIVPETRKDADARHFTEVADGLKALAKELDIPIIALSQLNRGVEGRDNKRPMLSDLRESGGLEQAADCTIMLYRDAYYRRQKGEEVHGPDETEFIFAKHRQGKEGTVKLWFTPECVRFDNELAPEGEPPPAYGDGRAGYE